MRLAVFGGSFNPIHIGHLILADNVCRCLNYDKIVFVPAYRPPHKELNSSVTDCERVQLVKLAISSDSRFCVDTCELERKGVSYTFDTICFLQNKYKGKLTGKIGLIVGDDLLQDFHKWYKVDELVDAVDLIVAHRPVKADDKSVYSNKPTVEFSHNEGILTSSESRSIFEYQYRELSNPDIDISSTEIRSKIANGQAWRYLVSADVFDYIKEHKLYGYKSY